MDKKTFLRELRRELERLTFEERENAVSYYEEYLHEAGPEREAETIAGFGSPQAVAAQIKVDYALQMPPKTPREGFKKVWLVILGIFAAPIAIPLAFGFAVTMFALFITMAVLVFSIALMALALVGGGLFSAVVALPLLVSDFPTFLFFLGYGIAMIGLGTLLGYAIYVVTIKITGAFARWLSRSLNKMKEKHTK